MEEEVHDDACGAYKGRPDLCDCGVLAREKAAAERAERQRLISVLGELITAAEHLDSLAGDPDWPNPSIERAIEYLQEISPRQTIKHVSVEVVIANEERSAYRTMKFFTRASTEERDPSMADIYSMVAALKEGARHFEQMTSGPPVDETTRAWLLPG